jgi:hypothetical protein
MFVAVICRAQLLFTNGENRRRKEGVGTGSVQACSSGDRSEDMVDIQRISVQQAHAKTKAKQALLVCAYDDEAKCRMLNLEGSISFASLQSRAASLPKTQEIIFY